MEHIGAHLKIVPTSKMTSKRQWVISQFVEEINKEREGTKYEAIKGKAMGIRLAHMKSVHELEMFLSECRDYKRRNGSFSKRFFGGFKNQDFKGATG